MYGSSSRKYTVDDRTLHEHAMETAKTLGPANEGQKLDLQVLGSVVHGNPLPAAVAKKRPSFVDRLLKLVK